jgi:hypothetical protein
VHQDLENEDQGIKGERATAHGIEDTTHSSTERLPAETIKGEMAINLRLLETNSLKEGAM